MKSLYFVLLATLISIAACEKILESPAKSFSGTWIIKKHYADPGNGSGRYADVTGVPAPGITFQPGNNASSDYKYFGLGMLAGYEVLDSVRIKFTFKEISSNPATIYRYKFSGDTLILNPPCFEGCGIKLVKAPSL
jgi:hypothetical protein